MWLVAAVVATSSMDCKIRLWDVSTRKLRSEIDAGPGLLRCWVAPPVLMGLFGGVAHSMTALLSS